MKYKYLFMIMMIIPLSYAVLEGDISTGINNTFISGDQTINNFIGLQNETDANLTNVYITGLLGVGTDNPEKTFQVNGTSLFTNDIDILTNTVRVGIEDIENGRFIMFGKSDTSGAQFQMYNGATLDSVIDYWNFGASTSAGGSFKISAVEPDLTGHRAFTIIDSLEPDINISEDLMVYKNFDVGEFKVNISNSGDVNATNFYGAFIGDGTNINNVNVKLNDVTNPTADKAFVMTTRQLKFTWTNPTTSDGALELEATGAFQGDLMHIHQHTGNPSNVDLLHIEAEDTDVLPLRITGVGDQIAIFETGMVNITDDLIVGGDVGIGTPNPTSLLHIDGGSEFILNIEGARTGSTNKIGSINVTNTDTVPYTAAMIKFHNDGAGDDGNIEFWTTNNKVITEKVVIDSGGDLGIGTSNPNRKLEVVGGINASGSSTDLFNIGYLTSVSGDFGAIAFNRETNASGRSSACFGRDTQCSGILSFGIGSGNEVASSNAGFVGGISSTSNGARSFGFGNNVHAEGDDSIALGREINVSGTNSVGFGLNNPAIDHNVTANNVLSIMGGNVGIGSGNPNIDLYIMESGNVADPAPTANTQFMGQDDGNNVNWAIVTDNRGTGSLLFGHPLATLDQGAVSYTHASSGNDFFTWNVIAGSAEMLLDKDGLHVGRTAQVPTHLFEIESDGGETGDIAFIFNDGNNVNREGIGVQTGEDTESGTNIFFNAYDGNGDLTGKLQTVAGVFALADVSDERLKENIINTSSNDVLDKFNNVKVRDFNFIENPNATLTGFVAQELITVFPEAVTYHPEKNYIRIEKRDKKTKKELEGNEIEERSNQVLSSIIIDGYSYYIDSSNQKTYDSYQEWQDDNYEQFEKNITESDVYMTSRTALIPDLVLAIQELIEINEQQELRIAELERLMGD